MLALPLFHILGPPLLALMVSGTEPGAAVQGTVSGADGELEAQDYRFLFLSPDEALHLCFRLSPLGSFLDGLTLLHFAPEAIPEANPEATLLHAQEDAWRLQYQNQGVEPGRLHGGGC